MQIKDSPFQHQFPILISESSFSSCCIALRASLPGAKPWMQMGFHWNFHPTLFRFLKLIRYLIIFRSILWTNSHSFIQQSATSSILADWNINLLDDAKYELAFKTVCTPSKLIKSLPGNSVVYSTAGIIDIDRVSPVVMTSSLSSNSQYLFPEIFFAQFTEEISCNIHNDIHISISSGLGAVSGADISYSCEFATLYWNFSPEQLDNVRLKKRIQWRYILNNYTYSNLRILT